MNWAAEIWFPVPSESLLIDCVHTGQANSCCDMSVCILKVFVLILGPDWRFLFRLVCLISINLSPKKDANPSQRLRLWFCASWSVLSYAMGAVMNEYRKISAWSSNFWASNFTWDQTGASVISSQRLNPWTVVWQPYCRVVVVVVGHVIFLAWGSNLTLQVYCNFCYCLNQGSCCASGEEFEWAAKGCEFGATCCFRRTHQGLG